MRIFTAKKSPDSCCRGNHRNNSMTTILKTLRRSLRPVITACAVMLACEASPGAEPVAPIAPLHGLKEVAYDKVTWRGGFWGKRLDIHQKTTIPHVLDKLEQNHHFDNFDVAAKVVAGEKSLTGNNAPDESTSPLEGDPSGGKLRTRLLKKPQGKALSATTPSIRTPTRDSKAPVTRSASTKIRHWRSGSTTSSIASSPPSKRTAT